jgi:hypothetical protein
MDLSDVLLEVLWEERKARERKKINPSGRRMEEKEKRTM